MINFEVSDIRKVTKMLTPTADFDSSFTFYYDETNNIRKFCVREIDFNSSFNSNFVLGGLIHEGTQPNIQSLFDSLNLQNNIKDIKLEHIAKGNFLNCLKYEKLNYFLTWLLDSDLYIHLERTNKVFRCCCKR